MIKGGHIINELRYFPPQICAIVNPLLEEHFPASSGVRIIAEPGRFYSASAFTLVVNVVARRTVKGSQLKETDKTVEAACFKDNDELVSLLPENFLKLNSKFHTTTTTLLQS